MWREFSNETEFDTRLAKRSTLPLLLFKHSPRCGISFDIKTSVDSELKLLNQKFDCYLVDVIRDRSLSQYIAKKSGVMHQSPQLIVFKQGTVLYHSSHFGINLQQIMKLENQS